MTDKYKHTLSVLERCGSVTLAAKELAVTPKTVRNRLKRFKKSAKDVLSSEVRGRNSNLSRPLLDGSLFYYNAPTAKQVVIADVVRGLARCAWESGQTHEFVSMAYISEKFSGYVYELTKNATLAECALFYYSYCGYIGYIPASVSKSVHGNYGQFKDRIVEAVLDSQYLLPYALLSKYSLDEMLVSFEEYITHSLDSLCSTDSYAYSPRADELRFAKAWKSIKLIGEIAHASDEK